jgi:two-component system, OmpR family, sensor histidine kinase KdpD
VTLPAAERLEPKSARRRGTLRVYLGAAPGVGKTFAMLNEGCRAQARGIDVVIGFVETHGRARTQAQCGDLEAVPRRVIEYRGTTFEEMDVDAILRRRPSRVLVDELAHTNVPGSRNEKRWQDVDELLDAGIDVISTVNIQHLESLNDVVERITGIRQRETIPDEVVRAADQVELVDQTPEALRRRMAHGNIYKPEKIDAALTNYFRAGNLAALRELALLWVADKVEIGLEDYRERHGITQPWETRERVVVAITGAPNTEALIRRAARIAQRAHGELLGVHVINDEGLAGPATELVEEHHKLLEEVGGEYHEVAGGDVGAALVEFARAANATQLVMGASQRSRWAELTRGSVINRVVRLSGSIDVHVISHERSHTERTSVARPAVRRLTNVSAIPPRRQAIGWAIVAIGVPLLTLLLAQLRDSTGLETVLLLYLTLVVTAAAIGGTWPAIVAAVAAFLCANWFFTPPLHTWSVAEGENVVSLIVFLGVALVVSRFVDAAARRTSEAARARGTATNLARLAATMAEADPLPALLAHLRNVFTLDAVALLHRVDGAWRVEASDGTPVPERPEDADLVEPLSHDVVLALNGQRIAAEDQIVLNAFAAQLAVVLEHGRLQVEASRAHSLAEANELRTALLQAVSHDLRTPLASIKASVTSLCQPEIEWSEEDTAEFLRTIDEETDRLTNLVENLLDMSRINAGVLTPTVRPVALEEVVPAALASLGDRAATVDADLSESLPRVLADPALLERVLANIIDNAVRVSPPDKRVRVAAGAYDGQIDLRVIDQGPGIPRQQRELVFQPFQRLGDNPGGTGVGLGLAVARGFASAMGATLDIDDTPGGGTTIGIMLPVAP